MAKRLRSRFSIIRLGCGHGHDLIGLAFIHQDLEFQCRELF